jgi:hypothetical protein
MMMKRLAFLTATALCLGGPAMAQQVFALPANCTAYLTVQMKSCTASHHFTCTGDPEGHQRRVDLDIRGMSYLGSIDAETQWIGSFHPFSGHVEELEPSPSQPASLTQLTETGTNSYDFRTLSDEIGETRYVGNDTLTGETVTIDGVTLEQTEYSIRAIDAEGREKWRASGREFISRDWRMFLSGKGTVTTPDDTFEIDDTPVEFIFPDQPGFLSLNPKFGCGAVMSSAPAADPALTLPRT